MIPVFVKRGNQPLKMMIIIKASTLSEVAGSIQSEGALGGLL